MLSKDSKSRKVAICATTLALTFLLSKIKISGIWLNGGGITLFSMAPIIILSFGYGKKEAMLVGFCYGILKLIFGFSHFASLTKIYDVIIAGMLDYILAYTAIGFASAFKINRIKNSYFNLCFCIICVFFLRFLFHFVSGIIVWSSLLDPKLPRTYIIYWSLHYNIFYILPEMIVTIIGVNAIRLKWPQLYGGEFNFEKHKFN